MDSLPETFAGGVHRFPVRVYYEDTDAAGVVYYANYLKFAERARSEMLRQLGMPPSALMADPGIAFAVRGLTVEYLKPARLDDLLEVRTRILEMKGASLDAEQVIGRGGSDLVRMQVRLACMNTSGRAARLPAAVRQRMDEMCTMNEGT